MTEKACSDKEFITLFKEKGATKTAKILGVNVRNVLRRRKTLEKQIQKDIVGPGLHTSQHPPLIQTARINLDIDNGLIFIGSDAHIWPGPQSTAMRAFIYLIKEMQPKTIVLNGDILDFSSISRHPSIGWEHKPSVQDEIESAQDILHEIEKAAGRGTRKLWPQGNHDIRLETRLANLDSSFVKMKGTQLSDHFPNWEKCWSVFINQNIVIKHRFKGGIHATHNNTLWAGKTIITGHLHSQKITPFTDYISTRWGVDTGCLADTNADAFVNYTEDNPKNWVSGFCILTIRGGRLLPPELVSVWDTDAVVFRGKVIKV